MSNLLTLKTQNPGSFYDQGSIWNEDYTKELASNVDADLDELSGTIEIGFSVGSPWDEDDREGRLVEVLGYDLAYALLGTEIEVVGCHKSMIKEYVKELWEEVIKGELCLQ